MTTEGKAPVISVVILNYNGAKWIARCLDSLKAQSIFEKIEIIVADNRSADGSDIMAEQMIQKWQNGKFVQNGGNLGYCEGNNRGAAVARGEFLFFLNNDTWLEPDCLEKLLIEVNRTGSQAATPLVMNYEDDSFQSLGIIGFDIFGLGSTRKYHTDTREVFMPEGCSYLINRAWFEKLGKFDPDYFMYSDEMDLSWRLWAAGGKAIAAPAARLHHRGAVHVNPAGGGTVVEFRTSDTKRFYANRNALLVILEGAQHLLLILAALQVFYLLIEALAALVLVRRWSFVRITYFEAIKDCWVMRSKIAAKRQHLTQLRKRNDLVMLRFLNWQLNRWAEFNKLLKMGVPRVSGR